MRAHWITLLFVFVASGALAGQAPSTLDEWLAVAEAESPLLRAADARSDAALHAAAGAGSWTGPLVGYGWFVEPVQTRVGPQEHKLSITQVLPVFGRNGLDRDAATADAAAAQDSGDLLRDELRYRLVRLWNELWFLQESERVAREDLDLIEALHSSALAQYRAGSTTQVAVVRIELERDRLADELRRMSAARGPLVARINAELGRGPSARLEGGGSLERAGALVPSLAELRSAIGCSAAIGRAAQRSVAAGSRAGLARRDRWPTLSVGADWILTGEAIQPGVEGSGQDALMVRAALRLPWPSGGRGDEAARREAQFAAARADESRLGLELGAELEDAWFEFEESTRRIDLLDTSLVPSADLALTVTRSAFAAGEAGVGDLIEIHRTRLELALEIARVSVERANQIARLEFLTGSTFPAPEVQ